MSRVNRPLIASVAIHNGRMGRQLDDPGFDPENDEWVAGAARWDSLAASNSSRSGPQHSVKLSKVQPAPPLSSSDLRLIFAELDKGGLSMTNQSCLEALHAAGHKELGPDHIALVAELTGVWGATREWTGVPAGIRKSATALGERRRRRRTKRR